MSASGEDGTGFGRVIEQVLSDQKIKNETVPGKVGAFMGQMCPIAGFVLRIVSFSADVRASCLTILILLMLEQAAGFLPLKITANAVNAVVSVS